MDMKHPERLTNDSFMQHEALFRIFRDPITGHVPLHWHEFFEIAFIISGEGIHILNGTPHQISRGDMFLLTPADFHEIIPAEGSSLQLFNMIFSEQFLREELYHFLFQDTTKMVHTFSGHELETIEAEFERIWQEAEQRQLAAPFVIQGALERILIELARKTRLPDSTTDNQITQQELPIHQPLRKTLTYLQHHFREPITLEHAANQARLSPNYYSECFTKQLGISFQSYLLELRLQFAGSLLKVSELPITEISFASGFNTLPHFERMFKRKFGLPPRQYRRNASGKR